MSQSDRSESTDLATGRQKSGCDFAAGGDDNVIVKRVGNKVKEILTWKDKDTANTAGRFVHEIRRMGYRPGTAGISVFGDATGIGKTMCDLIRESGIAIVNFNFGGHSNDKAYKDEGTRVWYAVAKLIKSGRIAVPDRHHETVKKLFAQLTSRRQKARSSGCLWMESKAEMASRGVKSPDVADAFVIAFGVQPALSFSWMPYDGSGRLEVARSHGWTYTEDSRSNNEDSAGLSAFGCHSRW